MQWFLPLLNPFLHDALLTMQPHQREILPQLALVTGISLYDREGYCLGHFKSVTAPYLHFTLDHNCCLRAGACGNTLADVAACSKCFRLGNPWGALVHVFSHIMVVTNIYKVCAIDPAFRNAVIFLNKKEVLHPAMSLCRLTVVTCTI